MSTKPITASSWRRGAPNPCFRGLPAFVKAGSGIRERQYALAEEQARVERLNLANPAKGYYVSEYVEYHTSPDGVEKVTRRLTETKGEYRSTNPERYSSRHRERIEHARVEKESPRIVQTSRARTAEPQCHCACHHVCHCNCRLTPRPASSHHYEHHRSKAHAASSPHREHHVAFSSSVSKRRVPGRRQEHEVRHGEFGAAPLNASTPLEKAVEEWERAEREAGDGRALSASGRVLRELSREEKMEALRKARQHGKTIHPRGFLKEASYPPLVGESRDGLGGRALTDSRKPRPVRGASWAMLPTRDARTTYHGGASRYLGRGKEGREWNWKGERSHTKK